MPLNSCLELVEQPKVVRKRLHHTTRSRKRLGNKTGSLSLSVPELAPFLKLWHHTYRVGKRPLRKADQFTIGSGVAVYEMLRVEKSLCNRIFSCHVCC